MAGANSLWLPAPSTTTAVSGNVGEGSTMLPMAPGVVTLACPVRE